MNQTHIHLLITHLPIFGSILGAFVLAYGLWTKSHPTKNAAYLLFIITAIGAGIAYLTGEAAEETVENIPGILKATIEQHEEFALFALISLSILGASSIFALYMTLIKSTMTKSIAQIVLIISIISFGLVARTGYLGGQIRHVEISSAANQNTQAAEVEGDED